MKYLEKKISDYIMEDSNATKKNLEDNEVFEIVSKILRREPLSKYELISHTVVPLSTVNGFMGQYLNLHAMVKEPNSQVTRMLTFFMKLPPPAGSPQNKFNQEMGNCKKEFDIYKLVFPKIMSGMENDFYVPRCVFAQESKVIVLDDMLHLGFKMANKYEPFDYDHCAVLMNTLGKFHAKSIIFEEVAEKRLSDEFPDCVRETLWPLDKIRSIQMFNAALKGVISMIDLLSELRDDKRMRFKQKVRELLADHPKKLLPSKKFRNVLCHGDLWANNLLFKYNDDGRPLICCLIDFQLTRYNPPAHDILCFLQFSTVHDLRMQRLNDLLRIYHTSLTDCLIESGVDPSVFSWKELVSSIKDLRITSMMHGILNIPMQLIDEDVTNKYFVNGMENVKEDFHLDRSPLFCQQFTQVPVYNSRIRDALLELYEHVLN